MARRSRTATTTTSRAPTDPGFAWFEFDSANGPHTYYISAVDGTFTESELSASVTGG